MLYIKFDFSEFPTSQLEMDIVANLFDRDGSGLIDYKEFVSALRPDTHREVSFLFEIRS